MKAAFHKDEVCFGDALRQEIFGVVALVLIVIAV